MELAPTAGGWLGCHGSIQPAHQKGITRRDIKPSDILGTAKLTGTRLTDATLLT